MSRSSNDIPEDCLAGCHISRHRAWPKELSDGIARQHDQSEYSKDGAYRHVHAIEGGGDQAERVLFPPLDAAARVSSHRRHSPAKQDDGASDQKKDQSKHPRREGLLQHLTVNGSEGKVGRASGVPVKTSLIRC
jgi:hypothetical protein